MGCVLFATLKINARVTCYRCFLIPYIGRYVLSHLIAKRLKDPIVWERVSEEYLLTYSLAYSLLSNPFFSFIFFLLFSLYASPCLREKLLPRRSSVGCYDLFFKTH